MDQTHRPKKVWRSHMTMFTDGLHFNPDYGDIICIRDHEQITWRVNIPQRIKHHAPTGFSWGYGGSGPADLALNIMDLYLPPRWRKGGRGERNTTTPTWDGNFVSDEAFELHQEFKREFVALIPDFGGVIPGQDIVAFLARHDIEWTRDIWKPRYTRRRKNGEQAQEVTGDGYGRGDRAGASAAGRGVGSPEGVGEDPRGVDRSADVVARGAGGGGHADQDEAPLV